MTTDNRQHDLYHIAPDWSLTTRRVHQYETNLIFTDFTNTDKSSAMPHRLDDHDRDLRTYEDEDPDRHRRTAARVSTFATR